MITSLAFASIRMSNDIIRIGEGGGISFHKPMSSIDYTGTYWGTARTSYWSNTRIALWSTARNTEI